MSNSLTIRKPFDSHVHLRQGAMLRAVVPITAAKFSRAIVMPNTEPPIETVEQAAAYKKEILAALPRGISFEPLPTFYLTRNLSPVDIEKGAEGKISKVYAVKYYPYGATTNSEWGYRTIFEATEVLKKMEEVGIPLLLHGEVHVDDAGREIDPYEGEKRFIIDILPRLLEQYPKLKVSLEHASTKEAVDFMRKNGAENRLVATVTAHHLMYDKTSASPFLVCKPLLKSPEDREALRALVAEGHPLVSAGTDSAPHPEKKKLAEKPAFGVFSAPAAVELYTQIFDELGALEKLESFLSINGPRFFGLEPSAEKVALEKKDWRIDKPLATEDGESVRFFTDEPIRWHITDIGTS